MIGQRFGDYRITNYLGRGSTCDVYRASRASDPDSHCAIKVIRRNRAGDEASEVTIRGLYENMTRLRHRNIIEYRGFVIDGDSCFLIMEYVNGHALPALIQPAGIIPVIHALGLFKQTLEAFAYAHSLGVIHGRFTADKAIYSIDKKLKIGDFGLQPALRKLGANDGLSSLECLAPELREPGRSPTERSDVYSLGTFLIHLLTGRPANSNSESRELSDQLRQSRPDLPARVLHLVARATATDPAERFGSVGKLLTETMEEAIVDSGTAGSKTRAAQLPGEGSNSTSPVRSSGSVEPEMTLIPAGPFSMGSTHNLNEQPVKEITLPDFAIGRYVVTNRLYRVFCDHTGRRYPSDPESWTNYFRDYPDYPVIHVSSYEAKAYCDWLSQVTGKKYRLPSEAEWEKAARGGLHGKDYPWGDEGPDGRAHFGGRTYAWDPAPKGIQTLRVGSYAPNANGLFDAAGNVWEWCEDWFAPYEATAERKRRGIYKAARGGSWGADADMLRCAYRMNFSPTYRDYYLGFRVARSI